MIKYLYIYLGLIIIILFFAYKNSQIQMQLPVYKESFHPYIRQWYRPVVRNTRIYSNEWYNKIKEKVDRFWRKIGWLK